MSEQTAERDAVVAWLRRRDRMCIDELKSTPWYRPFERRFLRTIGGCCRAFALLIERDVHHTGNLPAETAILREAIRANAEQSK